MKNTEIDLITTEVIFNSVYGISKEIGTTLISYRYSSNLKQRVDCSKSMLTVNGEVIAQAPRIHIHLGSMIGTVENLLDVYPLEEMSPNDMFISNDPYVRGGQHLPDFNVVAPYFVDG